MKMSMQPYYKAGSIKNLDFEVISLSRKKTKPKTTGKSTCVDVRVCCAVELASKQIAKVKDNSETPELMKPIYLQINSSRVIDFSVQISARAKVKVFLS